MGGGWRQSGEVHQEAGAEGVMNESGLGMRREDDESEADCENWMGRRVCLVHFDCGGFV